MTSGSYPSRENSCGNRWDWKKSTWNVIPWKRYTGRQNPTTSRNGNRPSPWNTTRWSAHVLSLPNSDLTWRSGTWSTKGTRQKPFSTTSPMTAWISGNWSRFWRKHSTSGSRWNRSGPVRRQDVSGESGRADVNYAVPRSSRTLFPFPLLPPVIRTFP